MKKYLSLLVALVVTLFAASSFAFTPPPAPQSGWYVSDQAGKLSPAQINDLNQKIERVSKATKNEFGVLLLQDMGGDNIEDVASATFKAWGIGKRGLDNGCLIVVAIKERKSRIETGKGVEGEVTDLQANDILKKNLNPHLKQGDFAGGFNATVDALGSLLESRHAKKADPAPTTRSSGGCSTSQGVGTSDGSGGGFIWVLLALGAIGLVAAFVARASARRKREEAEALELELRRERQEAERAKRLAREAADRKVREEARLERERRAAQESLNIPTPVVPVPAITRSFSSRPSTVPRPTPRASTPPRASVPPSTHKETPVAKSVAAASASAAAATALAAQDEARRRRQREEDERAEARRAEARRRERDAEEEARRSRERDEEDRRKRQREEDDRRSSSSSSSSSFDWGSGSSGGSDSGGGFGGGDSGGGGSSSDW
jgi:uncharacterized protein